MDNNLILIAIISLGAIGAVAAVILYFVASKFKVIEDPMIDEVEAALPGANCGGCGYAGCRGLADAIVKAKSLNGFNCPAGGNETMAKVAKVMGLEAEEKEPEIAVVRCSGSYENAPKKVEYDGPQSCQFANNLFNGEGGCPNGCLGLGDCVLSCKFDAIHIDETSGLAVVDDEKCVGCNACVIACPRNIIELRPKGKKNRRIYVSCINKEKGAVAKKNCSVACIGCGKCVKVCAFDAITITNFNAYIDPEKCKLCRKCVAECPTGAIIELNFPPKKEKKPVVKQEDKLVDKTADTPKEENK